MAHAFIVIDASPEKHRMIQDLVNKQMRYEFQGKLRSGYTRPTLSEVKVYDIRCKEEVLPSVLRDLNVSLCEPTKMSKAKNPDIHNDESRMSPQRWINRMLTWFRLLTPFRAMPRAEGRPDPKYQLKGYHYAYLAGTLKDPRDKNGEEIL